MYVYGFRIKYEDPFGKTAYYHGSCASVEDLRMRSKIVVSDRQGRMSAHPAEIYQKSRAGRPAAAYEHVFIGVFI